MSAPDRAVIQVPKPLHAKLTEAKLQQEAELGRQVTFGEIIQQWYVAAEFMGIEKTGPRKAAS